jgi:hypothetical protein
MSPVCADGDVGDEGAKRGKAKKRNTATNGAVWFQTILMTKIFGQAPVNALGAAIVASGAVRFSCGPSTFVHTGIGIYEKTPRCPRGRSVHCWCFCTGTRSRSNHHRARCCPHDGPVRRPRHQEGRQEKGHQKGRQEENCPKGRLKQSGKASPRSQSPWPPLIQNRPHQRAFSLALRPCTQSQNFLRPVQSVPGAARCCSPCSLLN